MHVNPPARSLRSAPSPLDLRLILGAACLTLGGAMLAIAFFHLFENGTCSTNGYAHFGGINNASGRVYAVPYCAGGIGWWMLVGGIGVIALGVSAVLSTVEAGLAIATLFGGLCAGCIMLGLHVSAAHPMAGFGVSGARIFSFAMAAFFGVMGAGFGFAGKGTFASVGGSSATLALVAGGLGIAAAVLIGSLVSTGTATKLLPAAAPAESSTIAADSPASLYRAANLKPVLAAAQTRVGPTGFVEAVTLTPSELDLTVEDLDNAHPGTATTIRVGRGGAVTESSRFGFDQNGRSSIFMNSLVPGLPAEAAQATGVSLADITKITLVRTTNVLKDYFAVATTTGATKHFAFTSMVAGTAASAAATTSGASSVPAVPSTPVLPKGSYASCIVAAGTSVSTQNRCESLITGANAQSTAEKALKYSACVTKYPEDAMTKCASLLP